MAVSVRPAVAVALAALTGFVAVADAGRSVREEKAVDGPRVYSTWQTFTADDGLPDASVRSLHVSGDAVWVGTDAGLALRRDGGWKGWTAADGLPEAPISAIDEDPRTGDLWLGTLGGGLVRFTAGRFDRFTQFNSGLAGDQVLAVAVAEDRIWAATNGGISSYEPTVDGWDLYLDPRANMPETAVTSFGRGPDALHAGTWCGPPLRFEADDNDWRPLSSIRAGLAGGAREARRTGDAAVALSVAERSLWWVTQDGLFRRETGKRWDALRIPKGGIGAAFVTGLRARNEREAWVGTYSGLLTLADWETDTWVAYRRAEGASHGSVTLNRAGAVIDSRVMESTLPDNRVRCVAFQGDDVWVGTHSGLARGTDPADWRALEAAERAPASPDSSDRCRRHGARADEEMRQVPIGVLRALTKPIARPGADTPFPAYAVDRRSVGRAVERASARRRSQGQPEFALMEKLYTFARYGWGTHQDSFSILRGLHDVRGLIGYMGPDARIDTAMALRTEIPLVNIAPTDPTLDETANPWIFRCGSNDPRRHRLLLDFVLDVVGRSRLATVRTPGSEARVHLDRWTDRARERGHAPVAELEFDPETADLTSLFEDLQRSRAEVVLTWSDARNSAQLLRKMRSAGLDQLFVGSDLIVNPEFVSQTGPDPGEVLAFARCPHFEVADDVSPTNGDALRGLPGGSGRGTSPHADRSLHAAAHLLAAIELAGPDPDAIRGRLCEMSEVELAILEGGEWRLFVPETP